MTRTRPTVVVGDVETWSAMIDLAAALRRRGIVAHRLTVPPASARDRVRNRVQRLVYRHVTTSLALRADGTIDVTGALDALTPDVVAVEVEDAIGVAFADSTGWAQRRDLWRTGDRDGDRLLYDKLAMTRLAEKDAIPVPRTWATIDEIDRPYPVVVKARLGSGGRHVRIARTEVECREAWSELGATPDEVFAQELVDGGVLHVGGVAVGGKLVQAGAYRSHASPKTPLGPAIFVTMVDNPAVLEQAERLLACVDYTGAFCIDYMQPADGPPLMIDLNPRIFGTWFALQQAGLDMIGAWLHAHGLGPRPGERTARVGSEQTIVPANVALGTPGPLRGRARDVIRQIAAKSPQLGTRWAMLALAELVLSSALELARRVSGRRPEAPRAPSPAGP